ncbi:hypothetical protein RHMOL_Rhmol13G0045700 [Rhododendron molle]|uniref:Uncharacterized protein n=1 Tax=Rhododendron molle TaxID=49168 RepID=A0ACC0L3H4_RHOML|nr:hypothetical protein RHMOL_Rhmol13G0045700 [Rhododendron molle]
MASFSALVVTIPSFLALQIVLDSLLIKFNGWVEFDSDRGRTSRNGSSSKRAISASRPTSSTEPSEMRSSRLASSGGRVSTAQRIQPGVDPKSSSFTRTSIMKGTRDDPLRSFELLSIRK